MVIIEQIKSVLQGDIDICRRTIRQPSPSEQQRSEMVEYLQGHFREEEVANKVEFASFLKKRSELIEAGSPEDIKSNVLLNTIFKEKPISMQAAFTYKLAELYNACLREIGALQSFPKWETVQFKDSCKKFGESMSSKISKVRSHRRSFGRNRTI